eukprot:Lankesteria_metandrocarpae@DN5437_c1_g1_i1.p1
MSTYSAFNSLPPRSTSPGPPVQTPRIVESTTMMNHFGGCFENRGVWTDWTGSSFEFRRFKVDLQLSEAAKQLEDADKYLKRLKFNSFDPSTEELFEDWIDTAAAMVSRNRVCCQVFQEAWLAVSTQVMAAELQSIVDATSHEDLVHKFARILFPQSDLARVLEDLLWKGNRQATVLYAKHWLLKTAERYLRICERHGRNVSLSNDRFRECFLVSLPINVENEVRRTQLPNDFTDLLQRAFYCEKEITRNPVLQPVSAFVGEDVEMKKTELPTSQFSVKKTRFDTKRVFTCWCYGDEGHPKYKCPFLKARCANCGIIGHTSQVCRNLVQKDELGRIKARAQPKPSGMVVEHKDDHTLATPGFAEVSSTTQSLKSVAQSPCQNRFLLIYETHVCQDLIVRLLVSPISLHHLHKRQWHIP